MSCLNHKITSVEEVKENGKICGGVSERIVLLEKLAIDIEYKSANKFNI